MINNLPQYWTTTAIGELCTLFNGRAFKQSEWRSAGLPIIRIQNLNKPNSTFNYFDGELDDRHKVKEGDLLFAWSGTPGTSFGTHEWRGFDAALNQHIFKIQFEKEHVAKSFFRYAIDQKLEELIGAANGGVGLRHVTKGTFEKTVISFPPLAEQKVIADKLDTLLAQVETTKARLERIPEILKTFRQSVLAAAVSGRLTEEWRDEKFFDQTQPVNGKEKFKQELFEMAKETLPELPGSWLVIPAAKVLSYVTSGSRGWSNYYAETGALFLRMSNVRYDTTRLDLDDLQFVNLPDSVEGKRSLVKRDDLLISITADVGRVARIDVDFQEAYVNQHLALVRPTREINSEFLATCIAARNVGMRQVGELKRGATKAGLGLDDIRSLAIPLPPIEEQTEIIHRVEELFAFADTIEQKAAAALERVNNLSQSILAKAFRGELTADWRTANPELISGVNSAEALLAKIQAEREAIKKQPKPKRNAVKKKTGSRMSKQIVKVVDALKEAKKPLNGQELLAASGYPSDSNIDQLEQFFLDIREALVTQKAIVKIKRDDDGQDWFALAKPAADE